MLSVITAIAFKCSEGDVSLVLGIVGSILGCGVAYVIPSILKLKYILREKESGSGLSVEVMLNLVILLLGMTFGVLGVWVTLNESHH